MCFASFLPFRAPGSSFFRDFLFSDLLSSTLLFSLPLPISAFHLSILSEVWLLNFLRWAQTTTEKRAVLYFIVTRSWDRQGDHTVSLGMPVRQAGPTLRCCWPLGHLAVLSNGTGLIAQDQPWPLRCGEWSKLEKISPSITEPKPKWPKRKPFSRMAGFRS